MLGLSKESCRSLFLVAAFLRLCVGGFEESELSLFLYLYCSFAWRPGGDQAKDEKAPGGPPINKCPNLLEYLERARRFERPTLTLARLCSTPELRPRSGK